MDLKKLKEDTILMNLLNETLDALETHGKTPADVKYVKNRQHYATWQAFENAAKNFIYDNGYGIEEVSVSLMIVGDDWWLERSTYDGSEWWSYKSLPKIDPEIKLANTIELD